ncbi:MAG: hypothetical protein E5X33_10915 [Mesorhizobium sp.]|uniref:hypothetical protein n=1 Tax=Mesorhizobium sp. TaxID=1871066 RepID=UPI000FE65E6A|nr:hypothetical protein [Mesorhizobium sp.]RWI95470.1 MAG: hypothetical protein EOR22_09070 [Mesorhizobium sp.]TIR21591.1 MAG: hypothetical protein E5X33_10915 [Mesorhizobium sp.]
MTDAERAAKKRERQRAYRALNPEKVRLARQRYLTKPGTRERQRAADKKYREKHRDAVIARQALYRLMHPEAAAASTKRYHDKNRVEINARYREVYRLDPDKILARQRAAYARKRSMLQANCSPEMLMKAVYAAIPPALPKFIRDEVAGEMMLAVLEGTLLMDHIRKSVAEQLRRYNRGYDTFKILSLDAPIAGTEDLRRIDMISSSDSVFQFAV